MTTRPWTDEEQELIIDQCGLKPTAQLAAAINRTPRAVRDKLRVMGVSVYSNFYSARVLARQLGISRTCIMRWHKKGWLKGKRATWRRGAMSPPLLILEQDIVNFLTRFFYLFSVEDYRRIEHPYFKKVLRDAHYNYWDRAT